MRKHIPPALRSLVRSRARGICEYCLIAEEDTFLGCQIEHIISIKHNGPTHETNLALACTFCNQAKGTDIAGVAPKTGTLVRLFNPRSDLWKEHFRLAGSQIEGVTDIGMATVVLLRLNEEDRILEREELIAVKRYPPAAALEHILD
jgi:hypothetical protein